MTNLAIKEGFYRTRDGRRVRVWPSGYDNLPWDGHLFGTTEYMRFEADGRRWSSANLPETDLVAEWSDDPAAAAPVDLSQIKPGDRINPTQDLVVSEVSANGVWVSVGVKLLWVPFELIAAHKPADAKESAHG